MPRLKKTESQRRAERFERLYRISKADKGYTDMQIAGVLGMDPDTLRARRRAPEKFTLGEISKLSSIMGWENDTCMSFIRP